MIIKRSATSTKARDNGRSWLRLTSVLRTPGLGSSKGLRQTLLGRIRPQPDTMMDQGHNTQVRRRASPTQALPGEKEWKGERRVQTERGRDGGRTPWNRKRRWVTGHEPQVGGTMAYMQRAISCTSSYIYLFLDLLFSIHNVGLGFISPHWNGTLWQVGRDEAQSSNKCRIG